MPKDLMSERVVKTIGTARSALEKVQLVMAAAALGVDELGAFLRREGIHETELEQWRAAVLEGGQAALEGGGGAPRPASRPGDTRRIKELERELRRKDKALAETAALLVLQKKSGRSGGTRTTTPTRGTRSDPCLGRRGRRGGRTPRTGLRDPRHHRAHDATLA